MNGPVRFIRKHGRVIPIRDAAATGAKVAAVGAAAYELHKGAKQKQNFIDKFKPKIKINKGLDALGLGLSVVSGAVGAATFGRSAKSFVGGMVASHGIDALGITANVASVKGHGQRAERIKQATRQEARNLVVGNAVYFGGILATKGGRKIVGTGVSKAVGIARKFLRLG